MTEKPNISELVARGSAGFVIEWLCAFLGQPDAEMVKARLVAWAREGRSDDPETLWAWVDGRETGGTRHDG